MTFQHEGRERDYQVKEPTEGSFTEPQTGMALGLVWLDRKEMQGFVVYSEHL